MSPIIRSDKKSRKIPVCMIVDDGAPFINTKWVNDKSVYSETPTSFYREFGLWARKKGVKGKFSIVPCPGGIKCIDGSLGEFPAHTRTDRLEWIQMIKTLYASRWTITPEIITHWYPWDIKAATVQADSPKENVWLAEQPLLIQTRYITEAMVMLRNADIKAGGVTMCWSYPKEKNRLLGEAALRAAQMVYGLHYVIIFNDTGERPGIIYHGKAEEMAVSLRPNVGDVYRHTFGKMKGNDIQRDADSYITVDGRQGKFVDQLGKGDCLIFYTHAQTLYGNGTKSGFKVFQIVIERLHEHYSDRIQWMTAEEICQYFCPPIF